MKRSKTILASLNIIPYHKSISSVNISTIPKTPPMKYPILTRSQTKWKLQSHIPIPKQATIPAATNSNSNQKPKSKPRLSFMSYAIMKTMPNTNSKEHQIKKQKQLYLNVSTDFLTQDTLSSQIKSIIHQATQPTPSIESIQDIKNKNNTRTALAMSKPVKKAETAKQFLNKTQELIKLKYTSKIKSEQLQRLKETNENDIETINDRMKTIREVKELFLVTFSGKFNQYIKHLLLQRNAEKVELKRFKSEKVQSENDLMNIQFKIRLKERELVKKEKWYLLQKVFNDKQLPNNDKSNTTPTHSNASSTDVNATSGINNSNSNSNKTHEIKLFFNTPEEFIFELKKYEMYNLLLLSKYNDINVEIREMQMQLNIQLLEMNNEVMHLISLKDQMRFTLHQLKSKHNELLKEKQLLLSINDTNFNEDTSPKLYQTILSMHHSIVNTAVMFMSHLRLRSPVDTTSMLSILTFIERTADYFINKNNKYLIHNSLYNEKIYQVAKKRALKDRQAIMSMKIKEDNTNKTIQLVNKVNKKINTVYFIPFRKVDKYYYKNAHIKNVKKTQKACNKTDDIVDINDLLHDIIE